MTKSVRPKTADARVAQRHPVDYIVAASLEPKRRVHLHMVDLSALGFSALHDEGLRPEDSLIMDLPVIGSIQATVVWADGERAGFEFERLICFDELGRLISIIRNRDGLTR